MNDLVQEESLIYNLPHDACYKPWFDKRQIFRQEAPFPKQHYVAAQKTQCMRAFPQVYKLEYKKIDDFN